MKLLFIESLFGAILMFASFTTAYSQQISPCGLIDLPAAEAALSSKLKKNSSASDEKPQTINLSNDSFATMYSCGFQSQDGKFKLGVMLLDHVSLKAAKIDFDGWATGSIFPATPPFEYAQISGLGEEAASFIPSRRSGGKNSEFGFVIRKGQRVLILTMRPHDDNFVAGSLERLRPIADKAAQKF